MAVVPLTPHGRTPPVLGRDLEGKTRVESEIIRVVRDYRRISHDARRLRADKNQENWSFFWGEQDFSYKKPGQSAEFLPDFPMSVLQASAVVQRALVDDPDYLDVTPIGLGLPVLDPAACRRLMLFYLDRLYLPGNRTDTTYSFPVLMGEAMTLAFLEAEPTIKVLPVEVEKPAYRLEASVRVVEGPDGLPVEVPAPQVIREVTTSFRLQLILIPYEDFFPDPSGHGRFDIHETERLIATLRQNPDYDPEVIDRLRDLDAAGDQERIKRERTGHAQTTGLKAGVVRLRECWGDVLDDRTGHTLVTNSVLTLTERDDLLRPPQPNPRWDARRPFASGPLIRVPGSTVHKAMADHAVPMAKTRNELWNLLVDGGIESVHNVRIFRPQHLDNRDEVTKGIPPGWTAVVKDHAPHDYTPLEYVTGPQPPAYGYQLFQESGRELGAAMAVSDLQRGQFPPRQTKATEAVMVENASTGLYDAMGSTQEATVVEPTLELVWNTIWQHLDSVHDPQLVALLGEETAAHLASLTPEARFVAFADQVSFTFTGLRGISARPRAAQRLLGALQAIGTNEQFMAEFAREFSVARTLGVLFRNLNVDVSEIKLTAVEKQQRLLAEMQAAQQAALLEAQATGAAPTAGGSPESPEATEPGAGEAEMVQGNEEGERGLQVGGEPVA